MSNGEAADDEVEVPDEVIAKVTDLVDGKLSDSEKAEVEAKIASERREDRAWRQAHEEAIIIKVTDYIEGKLTGAEMAAVQAKLESGKPEHRAWKQTHDEMADARKVISGMRKAKPPDAFVENVTETIHKRSGGRFFARKTLGDRVPFGVLLIVAFLALGVVGYLMWSSPTGSLKVNKQPDVPKHKPLDIERP